MDYIDYMKHTMKSHTPDHMKFALMIFVYRPLIHEVPVDNFCRPLGISVAWAAIRQEPTVDLSAKKAMAPCPTCCQSGFSIRIQHEASVFLERFYVSYACKIPNPTMVWVWVSQADYNYFDIILIYFSPIPKVIGLLDNIRYNLCLECFQKPSSSCWWNGLDHWRSFLCLADLVADGDHRLVMVGLGCLESGVDSWWVRRWFCWSFYGHFGQWFSEHVDDDYSHNFKDDCSVNVDVRVFF